MNLENYYRIKSAFIRGCGGAYVPKTDMETVKKFIDEGYPTRYLDDDRFPVVKIVNKDAKCYLK